jgi:hypothetical protein
MVVCAAVHLPRHAGRLLTSKVPGLSDLHADERRWHFCACATDPTKAPAYQKRLQRARQQKAPQVKPCRLQQQRERFQGGPWQAYKQQRSIRARAMVRTETRVFIRPYGGRKAPIYFMLDTLSSVRVTEPRRGVTPASAERSVAAGRPESPKQSAAVPMALECDRRHRRGHPAQSRRRARLRSASTARALRGCAPGNPRADTYRVLHRTYRGDGAYNAPFRPYPPTRGDAALRVRCGPAPRSEAEQDAYQTGMTGCGVGMAGSTVLCLGGPPRGLLPAVGINLMWSYQILLAGWQRWGHRPRAGHAWSMRLVIRPVSLPCSAVGNLVEYLRSRRGAQVAYLRLHGAPAFGFLRQTVPHRNPLWSV